MFGALRRLLRGGAQRPDPREAARLEAQRILERAEQDAKARLLTAQEQAIQKRTEVETESRAMRLEIQRHEERLNRREEQLDRKLTDVDRRDQNLRRQEHTLEEREQQIEALIGEQQHRLEQVAQLTAGEARQQLLAAIDQEVRDDAIRRMHQTEATILDEADHRARRILAATMQRVQSEVTTETLVSVVPIPSDDVKGRIIGREGRNIRALEAALGCDIIIDDTPDAVTLSSFDSVRREIGRVSLTRLIQDGRIHPSRIEEVVAKVRRETEQGMRQAGEAAALEADCPGLHGEILNIFGRLRYRTSYGQNQLRHAVETAHVAGMLAHELGANVEVARRGGLLHDLGKAVDHEVEGTHALIGADIARRFGIPAPIVHCIEAHHGEVEPTTVEAIIVQIADGVSGGRPGARRESTDRYIKRLEAMEEIATSFAGVNHAYAIQAGRELRVIVVPETVDDLDAMRLARDISRKLEENMQYPGQIKVTVVRETRAAAVAR